MYRLLQRGAAGVCRPECVPKSRHVTDVPGEVAAAGQRGVALGSTQCAACAPAGVGRPLTTAHQTPPVINPNLFGTETSSSPMRKAYKWHTSTSHWFALVGRAAEVGY